MATSKSETCEAQEDEQEQNNLWCAEDRSCTEIRRPLFETEGDYFQMMVPENMKKQLALAVRSIQWSYAIFWSASSSQTGVLKWGEGYYNGDIKTRKTSQAVQLSSDQIGLQRSEQLRGLFESLATAESTPQIKRPSTTLSPEDLTDAEWYYLVCMSFVFNIGQGLPGRTLANGQPIWVYNAPRADTRVFSRSLLAKSASIQTVVCFPFLEGVVELGTSDLISEDLSLIQRIKTSFLDILNANKSGSTFKTRNNQDIASVAFGRSAYDAKLPEVGSAVNNKTFANSSNAIEANLLADETHMVEMINDGASQVQSWQVLDDELSNDAYNSITSSDCSSQTLADPEKTASGPKDQNPTDHSAQDLQECNKTKMTLKDRRNDDWHYRKVLSAVLKDSDQLAIRAQFYSDKESSFVSCKKRGSMSLQTLRGGTTQKLLKKVLFEVPRMHMDGLLECQEENDYKERMRPEVDEIGMNHVLSERRRRAKLNERLLTLRSMVPSVSKDDKVSILDDAIKYLRKLEKKVRELEACRELIHLETKAKRTPQDMVERTSDNYFNKTDNGMKSMNNKRKACDIEEETWLENDSFALNDSSTSSVTISLSNTDALIEVKCPWREGVVMKIMEALRSFHLDLRSIQSSEADRILHLIIRSQLRGPTIASVKTIKQALQKVASNC